MGLGVGRLGCLLNGDDFGLVVQPSDTMLLASLMPTMHGAGPGDALRYATQLQESLFSIALSSVVVLLLYATRINANSKVTGLMNIPKRMHPGQIGAFAGAASCLNRAWNEGFREGVRTDFFGMQLSPWHIVSLALAGALVLCGIWFGRTNRGPMTYRASQS
jgi:prolipoprotein diacylglyceryltransferase